MKKIFFTVALFFAALSFGFVSCENPDDEPGFSLENVGQDDEEETPAPVTYTLTVLSSDEAMGTVTGGGTYEEGTEVTLTATPKENYYFTGWSDSDSKELTRTVQVNSDTTITANFAKKPYLTVKTNNNYGTVEGSGYYEPNTEVAITAIPNYDYIEFVQWSDGNTENPRTITVTSDVTYTATFKVNLPDGAFLVNSNGKCVYFSPGNLQYTESTDTWSFAENQYDYIGTDNATGGTVSSDPILGDEKEGYDLAYKIDLFAWSMRDNHFGVYDIGPYNSGSFVDWGRNQIGDDVPNTWRTLTKDEWKYLLNTRPNASSLKGVAQVNGVNGLILLPDGWSCPDGVTFRSGFHDSSGVDYYAAYQTFTAAEWSKMEAAGAVFLPAAGRRYGSDVDRVQHGGHYWSATKDDGLYYAALRLDFASDEASTGYLTGTNCGQSVRLVKDL